MNKWWPKWIFASVMKHFDDERGDTPLFIQGESFTPGDLKEYAEIRLRGPNFREVSRGTTEISLDIAIMITVAKGNSNTFLIHEIAGTFMAACESIEILKLGSNEEEDDPEEVVFCLTPQGDIRWQFFGQPKNDTDVVQGVINARYQITIAQE